MEPSKKDWINPRQSTLGSVEEARHLINFKTSKTDWLQIIHQLLTFWNAIKPGIFPKNSKNILKCRYYCYIVIVVSFIVLHSLPGPRRCAQSMSFLVIWTLALYECQ